MVVFLFHVHTYQRFFVSADESSLRNEIKPAALLMRHFAISVGSLTLEILAVSNN